MNSVSKAACSLLLGAAMFSHGVAAAGERYTESDMVIPPVYSAAKPFSEGLAVVVDESGAYYITPDGKRAFGDKVFKGDFNGPGSFSEGLAAVLIDQKIGYKIGYINKQGKMSIPPRFDQGKAFKNGKALVSTGRGLWAFIDAQGEIIASLGGLRWWPGPEPEFADNRACFQQDNLYGYADEHGKHVIPPRYKRTQGFSEGLANVQLDTYDLNNWTFIDRNGEIAMTRRFYSAQPFKNGLALVAPTADDRTRQEYINTRGETVFALSKEETAYRNGDDVEVMVCKGYHSQCGLKDKNGEWIIDPVFPPFGPFHDGLAVFEATEERESQVSLRRAGAPTTLATGVINRKGEIVVEGGTYRHIEPYEHGLARVALMSDPPGSIPTRFIDTRGKLVENFLLPVGEPSDGLQLVMNKDGKYGFVKAR